MRRSPSALFTAAIGALLASLGSSSCSSDESPRWPPGARERCEETSSTTFERRIAPLLQADRPKTCNQCHLSGIDLSMFARESACETVACLVELGLADPNEPEQSRVLDWIRRGQPDSELITQEIIDEEYEGFREWLVESLTCEQGACLSVRCSPRSAPSCQLNDELADIAPAELEPCSDAELELLFRDNVFADRGRCFPCHHEGQPSAVEAPLFFATTGDCNSASLTTQRTMLRSGYLDLEQPEQSLLLLKPLAESAGGVEHGGHTKFSSQDDATYQAFLAYIERLSECSTP